jgi:hypothetical protein
MRFSECCVILSRACLRIEACVILAFSCAAENHGSDTSVNAEESDDDGFKFTR